MSNVCKSSAGNKLILIIDNEEGFAQFTTLLQSGIYMDAPQGCSIGEILCSLPGFTEEYVSKKVQTLFLNGIPADDLDQQIFGENAVIAASAAMPGLAGAIFRTGGRHASLRTDPVKDMGSPPRGLKHAVSIRIKLFNLIAKERGKDLLSAGCVIKATALLNFLLHREQVAGKIICAESDTEKLNAGQLFEFLESQTNIHLFITKKQ